MAAKIIPQIRANQCGAKDVSLWVKIDLRPSHEGCPFYNSCPPQLLAKVVDLIDKTPMEDRDTKGDIYEYMLGKIASAGQNGQFRTPRHIIKLMVELVEPMAKDIICDPACGTAGFLIAAGEYLREHRL